MTFPSRFGRHPGFTVLIDAIQYELGPYLRSRGASIWIEELASSAIVVGFKCSRSPHKAALWSWLHGRLCKIVPESDRASVIVRDFDEPTRTLDQRL